MTLEDAVEALAKRAADLRSRPATFQEKAAAPGDILTSLGQQFRENPLLQQSLLGAGLGAGVGGVSTMLGNRGKEERERKSLVSGLLTGGLAGAAIGGGAGLAQHMLTRGGGGQGLASGDALRPGQFKGPDGRTMQIDPKALRENPELAEQVRRLSSPMEWYEKAPLTALDKIKDVYTNTWSAAPMTGIAAIDALSHSNRLRLGEKNWTNAPASIMSGLGKGVEKLTGGRTSLGLNRAADWWRSSVGDKLPFGYGMVDPRNSRMVEHLDAGVNDALAGKGGRFNDHQKELLRQLAGDRKRMEEIARDSRNRGGGQSGTVTTSEEVPVRRKLTDYKVDPAGGGEKPERIREVMGTKNRSSTKTVAVGAEDMRHLVERGAQIRAENFGKNKALGTAHSQPRVFRGLTGDREIPTGAFAGARGLGRGLLYAGIPLAEYTARTYLEQMNREQSLRDLMQRHARPVEGQ